MKAGTISLCLIARNEGENIGRCIRSAGDFVDEVVVVDTGSADDTVEIARSLGARVVEAEWKGDFSAARNVSLDHAGGEWIFFLDCDEELTPESGPELRKVIQNTGYEAFFVLVTNPTETGVELTFPSIRLFRNRKCFRFTGRIHEQIVNSIVQHYGQDCIGETRITIIHRGYDTGFANIRAKILRNLEILKTYRDDEKDGFFYYNLGTEYLRLGERKKALENFLIALGLTKPAQTYGPILVKRTMTTLMELHRYRDAVRQLRYYQGIYREFTDLVLLEAVCHLNCGRYSAARSRLEDYLAMPSPPVWYPTEKVWRGSSAQEFLDRVRGLSIGERRPSLSVCIIGRDEAGLVGRSIQSVNEIAGEVIFVDTGSTDRSAAVAYQMGANVYNFPWDDDFAAARNFATGKAKGDWILVLDADEVLPDESRKSIVDLLRNPRHEGYVLKICTFLDRNLSPASCQVKGACRLFRNRHYRYQGAVFEDVTRSIVTSGATITPVDITIYHLHCLAEDETIARKRKWKTAAIERGLAAKPRKLAYAMGLEAFYARDFALAADQFARAGNTGGARPADFYYFYALSLVNVGRYFLAEGLLDEGVRLFPDYTDLFYLKAISHFMEGKTNQAEALLRRCLAMGDAPWDKYIASPGAGSFLALCTLGTIYAQKGDIDKALAMFIKAAAMPGACEEALERITFLCRRLSVPPEHFLEKLGMYNSRSLSTASRALTKMGRFGESLRYLNLAGRLVAQEPPPRDFSHILRALNFLLAGFSRHIARGLPENSPLRSQLVI